ncbi:hypothetical protein BCR35DRAFT_328197 [Leucosporidium creatinivorum]|uniref:Uncharacterized protein n=1 Tax=Leucosporidium creatinivorum TaxID=106004 RepID=A0A1Y2G480_9BASI|nr:hypothetical protein BCR35DRAFT_328197 [Leucosporidium creatinivorum]
MSQGEGSSPSDSPPSSQAPSRHLSSSQWDLPPETDFTSSFKYSKATPAGLASGGGKAQNGETSARGAGKSGSRGLGSSTEGVKSGGEKGDATSGGTGMSVSRDDRKGRAREEDDEEETREKEQSRRGATSSSEDEEDVRIKDSQPTEDQQQQQSEEQSKGGTPQPNKLLPSSAGEFAAQFRLGMPGGSGLHQNHASRFSYTSASAAANPNRPPISNPFAGFAGGSATPPSSQFLASVASAAGQPPSAHNRLSFTNPDSRSLAAPSTSRSTSQPLAPPPSHASHPSARHQHPAQPRRPTQPLSPHHAQARGGQNQENNRPTTTRDGAASANAAGATNSKKRGYPSTSGDAEVPRTGSNSSARAGGDGSRAPRADGSPSAKKRKSEKGEKGVVGFEDIVASITTFKIQSEKKDAEVVSLRARLVEKEKEVERLRSEKDTLKRDAIGKVNLALSRLETTRKELSDVSSGMRAATTKLQAEMGSPTNLVELRDELNSAKQLFQRNYFDPEGALWLERNEESKIAALRALQTEIQQRQDVISLLRDQLATKTGEIVEARDRIAQLEQLQANHHLASADLEQSRKESRLREDELREKRVDAENRLDEALLKAGDREAALEEKLERTREEFEDKVESLKKGLDDAQLTISASETETAALAASKLRLEKELSESNGEMDALKTKFESLNISFDEFRTNARAEKERMEEDLNTWRLKNNQQEDVLSRQAIELEELLRLSSKLTQVKIDLDVAEQKVINDATAAAASLEREKIVSQDLSRRNDTLLTQLEAKEAQLVEQSKRFSESQNKVTTIQSSLDTLQLREKELKFRETELSTELERARAELSNTQQSNHRQDTQTENRLMKQIDDLQLEITTLKAANETLTREQRSSEQKIGDLNNVVSTLKDAKASAEGDARRLQQELSLANAARDSLLHVEGDLAQLKRDQTTMLQTRIKETVASCQEGHSRERAQLSNELKRANNKLEELTTRNQKLSTELAKSKNRPMIDPHISSSSPVVSPARGRPESEQLGAEEIPPQQAPASDDSSANTVATTTLSAIDAMDQERGDDELTAEVAEEEAKPSKLKKEEKHVSSASTAQAILVPPIAVTVKKDKGKAVAMAAAGASSTSRALRTTRRRTMDPEQEDRNADEDEIEEVVTQVYRHEDEIEDVTQVNRRDKSRPSTKTTYSRKRKDVKR